ncbi:hypothetical protein Tco_0411693 [Tanacetum coccineum]
MHENRRCSANVQFLRIYEAQIRDTTRAQQEALDEELVAPADRLKIGKINIRLSSILKSKEPTLQVALDALKLTPFYNAFKISADVPEIYMKELWVTVSRHHSLLHFKLNGKSHTVNVDNFRDMLKICPKLPELSKGANSLQAEEQDIPPPTITAMKIPIIRKGEYDIWSMRMRQYICHTDHNLWDIIVNGDLEEEPAPTTGETYAPPAPKTAKQLAARRN